MGEEDVLICKCAKHLQIKTLRNRAAFFWFVFFRRGKKMNRKHPYKSKFELTPKTESVLGGYGRTSINNSLML